MLLDLPSTLIPGALYALEGEIELTTETTPRGRSQHLLLRIGAIRHASVGQVEPLVFIKTTLAGKNAPGMSMHWFMSRLGPCYRNTLPTSLHLVQEVADADSE